MHICVSATSSATIFHEMRFCSCERKQAINPLHVSVVPMFCTISPCYAETIPFDLMTFN